MPHSSQKSPPTAVRPHLMRSIGHTLRSTKLGDLLVSAGLITSDQLKSALARQKASGEQLGKILVEAGALSAVHLYRKLAEQWCLKASAAGLTVMMHVVTPSTAFAETNTANVKLAAAFAAPAAKSISKPSPTGGALFGTAEIRSSDISAFTKWTTVMARFESQMGAQSGTPRVQQWKSTIQDLRGKSARAQISGVNDYINAVKYIEDKNNYRKSDYWATPLEFFSKGGDCEDYAIAKFASLRALGFSSDQMRIAIVQDKIKNIPHAILIVYTDEGTFVLDNQDKRTRTAQDVNRYQPIFSINSNNWWLHKSTPNV